MNIGEQLSRSIKEGKWVHISYLNGKKELTYYWIAIKDIDLSRRSLKVLMFNDKKSFNTIETFIYFDSIKTASVIDFSYFETPDSLIYKIEKNIDKCNWLNYDHFDYNILNYYIDCNELDNDPFQKEYYAVPGIDLNALRKNKKFNLTEEQEKIIINNIYNLDINKLNNVYNNLAINCFSISNHNKKYVVCYYEVKFDPHNKCLVLNKNLRFNQSFMVDGRRHSIFKYINMDPNEFMETFEKNYKDYEGIIAENLSYDEKIDTMPDMMLLSREVPVDLQDIYDEIDTRYKEGRLSTPLKSFFGNITKRNNIRKKEPSIIIYDKRVNINQMRVIYNALKYPVTYVQGPPGTGKTQTILNVVLSSFYNDRTVLICSSNNKPVDGIVEKLDFTYKGQKVSFPFLRLGNYDDVKKATLKIRELYKLESKLQPKENMLNQIKNSADDKNAKLIGMLDRQEKRLDIETCLENSEKLVKSFEGETGGITKVVKEKIEQLKQELKDYPEITNEELVSLFEPLKGNLKLTQFLYFKSLQYINKIKLPRYKQLIEICNYDDEELRVTEFNKWSQNDENMKLLVDAFPIIFSTNISSRRLGGNSFMFDKVIMDEAGQCNVATALIPISKAQTLLLVGDRNQLKPVILLDSETNNELMEQYHVSPSYDYRTNSILDVMVEHDNISKYILLKYHYRCGRKIINFSNQRYYGNELNLDNILKDGDLELLDVKNKNVSRKNEAYDEARAVVDYIKRNDVKDAFIITPFVNQKELISDMLKKENIKDIDCGTIHSLQGAEKDTIIFSPAISLKTSKRTYEWIKNNHEIINVGVTRAKDKFVIAGDYQVINTLSDKKDDLYNLVEYVKNNGKYSIPPNENAKIEIGNSNASVAENEFFKTISHFCSCHKTFDAERNVKISKLFKDDSILSNSNLEFDLVLYKKNILGQKTPVIAFEVNGGEHLGMRNREISDKRKMEICKSKKIKLIFIPNSFVKAYEYITDIIISAKDRKSTIQQTLFDFAE